MAKRVTYLIGPDGKIAKVWPSVTPVGHAREILDSLPPAP
jgi:peroxiredoxin Q/BCP